MSDTVLPLPQTFSLKLEDLRRTSRSLEDVVTDLYTKLRPSLLSYVYHLAGSTSDAEDLVQIAFLQLFDHLSQKEEVRNLRGWLYRAVHSLAVGQARRADRRESLIKKWFDESGAAEASAEEEMIRRVQIEQSLAMLSERERHALMLRAEGLSYQEIAEILETSAKSVSVYLARGLKKFESRYENGK